MKPTIVCLVGDSGSGKTFASLHLQEVLNWNSIVSYTTRKKRVHIPEELYDYIINNDYSIEAFRATLYLIGKCIERKYNNGSTKR